MELLFYSLSLSRGRTYSEFPLTVISARSEDYRTHDWLVFAKANDWRTLLEDLDLVAVVYYLGHLLLFRRFSAWC